MQSIGELRAFGERPGETKRSFFRSLGREMWRIAPALYGAQRAPKMGEYRQKAIFSRTAKPHAQPRCS